jgi:hypothetical protein
MAMSTAEYTQSPLYDILWDLPRWLNAPEPSESDIISNVQNLIANEQGMPPERKGRLYWMLQCSPNPNYTAQRMLDSYNVNRSFGEVYLDLTEGSLFMGTGGGGRNTSEAGKLVFFFFSFGSFH